MRKSMQNRFFADYGTKISERINRLKIKMQSRKADLHYANVIKKVKASGRKRLNFAAYVVFDSTYGVDGVFKLMMQDQKRWNPVIVIIPDLSRGRVHAKQTYAKTKDFFINKYGKKYVVDGWDPNKNKFFDPIEQFDIVCYANPFDDMVHEYHKICYGSKKNVLPVYVSYGYDIGRYATINKLKNPELNIVWKLFADTTFSYEDFSQFRAVKNRNMVLAGYAKMDDLYHYPVVKNQRKKILIAPHHTVSMKILPLSNFLKYSDFILKLPVLFPEMDFIFRPHPLLFTALVNNHFWSQSQVNEYLDQLQGLGIEYSTGGDYLKLFAECDAIIHDCGSFTVEWLFTGKTGCFVYNDKLKSRYLTRLMNKALERYTIARSSQDILDFLKRISMIETNENNSMEKWVQDHIALNYPDVSNYLEKELYFLRRTKK